MSKNSLPLAKRTKTREATMDNSVRRHHQMAIGYALIAFGIGLAGVAVGETVAGPGMD